MGYAVAMLAVFGSVLAAAYSPGASLLREGWYSDAMASLAGWFLRLLGFPALVSGDAVYTDAADLRITPSQGLWACYPIVLAIAATWPARWRTKAVLIPAAVILVAAAAQLRIVSWMIASAHGQGMAWVVSCVFWPGVGATAFVTIVWLWWKKTGGGRGEADSCHSP